ncbi:MFS transporter [Candidatus Sumerlaeota bacterium]|nr:MFS transporter [Candidatus Sumerlaeota bacterium]
MSEPTQTENPQQDVPQEEPKYPSNFYAWYCVILLLGIYINSFLDRNILSLLVDDIKRDMGISDSQMGFLMGPAFAVLYIIAGLPIGWLVDRMSRRILVMIGQIFWSFASMGFGLSNNFAQMATARIAVGTGEATLSPSAYSIITDIFPRDKLARAISVYGMGIYLGGGLAYFIGGMVIGQTETDVIRDMGIFGQRFGWQLVFFIIILPTIPLTLLLFTVKEPARRNLGKVRDASGQFVAMKVPMAMFLAYFGANIVTFLCHNIGFAWLSFSGYGAGSWNPSILVRIHGWDPALTGKMLGLSSMIFGTTGILAGGWLGDYWRMKGRVDANIRVGLFCALAWFPFGIAYPLMPNGWLMVGFLSIATFISAMSWGVAPAAILEIVPNQMRGQATAIYLFTVNLLGLGFGPFILGLITDNVFKDPMRVHHSLLAVSLFAHTTAGILLFICLKNFRRTTQYLKEWKEKAESAG